VERFPTADHYKLQVEAFGATVRDGVDYPWTLEDATKTQVAIDAVLAAATNL